MAGLDRITGGIGRALTERSFRRFTLGNGIALIGYTMQRVAVAWLAWELTGSKSALGLLAFAELAPILFLAPLTGAIADRINPFTQFRIAQFLVLVHGVGLSILGFTGTISIEWLVAFQAFIGFVTSFSAPARMSLVSALVTTPNLSAAIALNALVFNISLVAGPLLMKPLLAVGGAHWAFVVHAFGFAVFNLMLIGVHPKAPERTAGARRGILRDVAAGMAYAARHATIGPLVALLVVTGLFARPILELLAAVSADMYGMAAEGFAVLSIAMGAGSVLGNLWLAHRGRLDGLAKIQSAVLLAMALSLAGLAVAPVFSVGVVFVAIVGMTLAANGIITQTLIQTTVDPALRGRVLSLFGMTVRGVPALGSLAAGIAADAFGLRAPVMVGAIVVLLAFAVFALRSRAIQRQAERAASESRP